MTNDRAFITRPATPQERLTHAQRRELAHSKIGHIHADRLARVAERRALSDAAAALAPAIQAVAQEHGVAPSTVARLAVAHMPRRIGR